MLELSSFQNKIKWVNFCLELHGFEEKKYCFGAEDNRVNTILVTTVQNDDVC